MNGRRVFTEVAAALKGVGQMVYGVEQRRADCLAVADAFAAMNSAFDRERFLCDCGVLPQSLLTPSLADVTLVMKHVKSLGRELTVQRLREAGVPHYWPTLSHVPPERIPALRLALLKDLGDS